MTVFALHYTDHNGDQHVVSVSARSPDDARAWFMRDRWQTGWIIDKVKVARGGAVGQAAGACDAET